MLEIYTRSEGPPIMCPVELERLLHDVRVVQGVPFLELDDGLLNLTEVVRIVEATPDTGPPLTEEAPEPCQHGFYVRSSCGWCKAIAEVEAQQVPEVRRHEFDFEVTRPDENKGLGLCACGWVVGDDIAITESDAEVKFNDHVGLPS